MVIYFSGEENLARPEVVLGDRANVMMSFAMCVKKGQPDKRFRLIHKSRTERKRNAQGSKK